MNKNNSIQNISTKKNSLETIDKVLLSEQTKFQLSEIIGIENFFYQEINQRKSCCKKVNKYVTTFDYIDKILIVLIKATEGVSIISFTSIIAAPIGKFYFNLFSNNWNNKKLLNITKKKKKKHDKTLMLAKSKLNSIVTLISQALIDKDISHEEFMTILKEKDRYEMMKDNLRNKNGESYEIMRFNSIKSKIRKIKNTLYIINKNVFFFLCIYKRKILVSILY